MSTLNSCDVEAACEMSFEEHPNNTSEAHLSALFDLGFERVSYGVQDYDPEVQKAINRIQPFETVKQAHEQAKGIGYTSVSHDLVFGLPFQTLAKYAYFATRLGAMNERKPTRAFFILR